MDNLQAAYLVCVAVHLAFWLYGHLKGPQRENTENLGMTTSLHLQAQVPPCGPRAGAHRCPHGVLIALMCATVRPLSTVTSGVTTTVTSRCQDPHEVVRMSFLCSL